MSRAQLRRQLEIEPAFFELQRLRVLGPAQATVLKRLGRMMKSARDRQTIDE